MNQIFKNMNKNKLTHIPVNKTELSTSENKNMAISDLSNIANSIILISQPHGNFCC